MSWRARVVFVVLGGCASAHAPFDASGVSLDAPDGGSAAADVSQGGSDAAVDTQDVGLDAQEPDCGASFSEVVCCHYGSACNWPADCTDPASPYCVPNFSMNICAADARCGHMCAAPDTRIATPHGERPIAELRVGMRVYSVDHGELRAVPIARVARNPVRDHAVVHVSLATGRSLDVSAGHPTADGRTFGDLAPGDSLDGVIVLAVETIPYVHDATYDILPASSTGTYVAEGVLIGSTLARSFTPACPTRAVD